jgi:hypothetical protein
MTRTLAARIAGAVLATGAAGAIALAGAGAANAQSYSSTPLSPGQGACSATQYASYQVRGDGWATGQGAKFKLLRNGVVVTNTPGRVNNWAFEGRTAYGTFAGPGYYSVCAQNTGTTNTIVTLQLRTDAEF